VTTPDPAAEPDERVCSDLTHVPTCTGLFHETVTDLRRMLDQVMADAEATRRKLTRDLETVRSANRAARERLAGGLRTEQHGLAEMVTLALDAVAEGPAKAADRWKDTADRWEAAANKAMSEVDRLREGVRALANSLSMIPAMPPPGGNGIASPTVSPTAVAARLRALLDGADTPASTGHDPYDCPQGRTTARCLIDCDHMHSPPSATLPALTDDPGVTQASDTQETKAVREAVTRLTAALVASHHLLSTPYTDAPDLTPWSRFIQPRLSDLRHAVGLDATPAGHSDGSQP